MKGVGYQLHNHGGDDDVQHEDDNMDWQDSFYDEDINPHGKSSFRIMDMKNANFYWLEKII